MSYWRGISQPEVDIKTYRYFIFAWIANFNRFDVHYLLLDYTLSFSKSVATEFTFRLQSLNTDSSRFRSQTFSPSFPFAVFCKTATFGTPLMFYIRFFRQASVSFHAPKYAEWRFICGIIVSYKLAAEL